MQFFLIELWFTDLPGQPAELLGLLNLLTSSGSRKLWSFSWFPELFFTFFSFFWTTEIDPMQEKEGANPKEMANKV